jgi:GTP-binding protein EngB required for normal cell division
MFSLLSPLPHRRTSAEMPLPESRPQSNTTYHSTMSDAEDPAKLLHLGGNYQERAQKMLGLINGLRDLQAQTDLDLPTVVVAGNQSVGKSSLLEAICGLRLPRGNGTVTRCAVEMRVHSAFMESAPGGQPFPWAGRVSIRREFDQDGNPIVFNPHSNTDAWVLECVNHQDVELAIRKAQKVLLNPSSDPSQYLNASSFELSRSADELLFTTNVVCVEIYGGAVDLSLIDLPGIIKSVSSNQDNKMIALIEQLVRNYIHKPRALILAVFTCKDEMENQAIFHMAREADPTGSRTIGVLTKPVCEFNFNQRIQLRWELLINGSIFCWDPNMG